MSSVPLLRMKRLTQYFFFANYEYLCGNRLEGYYRGISTAFTSRAVPVNLRRSTPMGEFQRMRRP